MHFDKFNPLYSTKQDEAIANEINLGTDFVVREGVPTDKVEPIRRQDRKKLE
jgi:hypothetical protein